MDDQQVHYGDDYKPIPATSISDGISLEIAPHVHYHTIQIVNICFVKLDTPGDFVLIDAGMPDSAEHIITATEEKFGEGAKPSAIILTHGHFDHVGGIIELIKRWNVPVYAHEKELPYLTGKKHYPKPDGTVEGGLIAKMSPMFPNDPIDLGGHVQALPIDGTIPHMTGWRWIHTPGHSPGHVSFFRDSDQTLIAGDAFVTVRQDSLYKVLAQEIEINGPPRYLTTDWKEAWKSVKTLAELNPSVAVTGHGGPVSGEELSTGLDILVNEFDRLAIPDHGKYVNDKEHYKKDH
ncbi:MBL fold metallo-hydrolase [Salirhabdus salicampi]|uniref:MBL fold metallo-hydrolase n=1 Tax=Salirhabdus salicampi TaxID=476102 RepID=UPI0020C28D55|nr:MBL fold metallo-hydrolase [Salirhabdus salicampi]MCP8615866.1 MBL fold metallo-hydrolase [Salirhabdus salicampi]